jgi:glycosyltransferase involved in cell wall biosynthesis
MKISIVTPSFNQGRYLRETLDSIHSGQAEVALQHWVMDAGSTDGSLSILDEFSSRGVLQYVCEPDRGQCDAINKGFQRCDGEVFCWLNSDDVFPPGVLPRIAELFARNPQLEWVTGDTRYIDAGGGYLKDGQLNHIDREDLIRVRKHLFQPSTFWRRSLYERVQGLDQNLHYALDYDLWLRFYESAQLQYYPETWSLTRLHADAKTSSSFQDNFLTEICRSSRRHWGPPWSGNYWSRAFEVGRYAGALYYSAATEARRNGKILEARRYLRQALQVRPWQVLYWKELFSLKQT